MFWGENSMDSWDQSKTGIKGKWFKFFFSFWLLVSPVTNFNYKWFLYSYFATVHNHTVLKGPVMFICRLEFYRVHHRLLNEKTNKQKGSIWPKKLQWLKSGATETTKCAWRAAYNQLVNKDLYPVDFPHPFFFALAATPLCNSHTFDRSTRKAACRPRKSFSQQKHFEGATENVHSGD